MTDKNEFRKVSGIAHKNNKSEEFNDIMDDYFEELAKYHPKIYVNLMKELHKLGAQTNIESQEELDKYIKHIHHKGIFVFYLIHSKQHVQSFQVIVSLHLFLIFLIRMVLIYYVNFGLFVYLNLHCYELHYRIEYGTTL